MANTTDRLKSNTTNLQQFSQCPNSSDDMASDDVGNEGNEGNAENNFPANEVIANTAASFCLENNIKANEFITLFKNQLVTVLKQAEPDIANVQIAVRTGLDRRVVSAANNQATKLSKDMLVLSYVRSYCIANKITRIKKRGPYHTFEYFCTLGANGTFTPNAIAQELLRLGHIEDKGSKYKIIL
ncbi:MAG: hypothetical protein L3J53_08070 [Proteobacteria bacterium]|nr:hypothetical protein [Pseudomonadota bacterium]